MAETRRNEDRDPTGNPSGSNLDAAGGPARNRPAAGAREANSPQAADSGWQPGLGATDFLGLEPDMRGGAQPGTDGGPTESWLFDIEQADASSNAAVATAAPARTTSALTDAELNAPANTAADDEFANGPEPVAATEGAAPTRRGSKRLLVTITVLALVCAGGWYGWQNYGGRLMKKFGGTEVASLPTPAPAKPTKPAKATPPTNTDTPTTPTPAPTPTDAVATATTPVETPAADPVPATEVAVAADAPVVPGPTPEVAVAPTPVPTVDAPLARDPNAVLKSPALPNGRPGPGGGRHATELDWAGMWLEPTIPTDAIRGPTRLRTLNVGLVRAELVNGEFVEGTLHAVGESRVWLDVKLGRISFDAAEVRDVVQIVGSQGQPVALGTQALAGLPRVEVLMPGGALTGRVLGREGDRVTFVTEDGLRMRVEALDVRPATDGRSRLVGPVGTRKP